MVAIAVMDEVMVVVVGMGAIRVLDVLSDVVMDVVIVATWLRIEMVNSL